MSQIEKLQSGLGAAPEGATVRPILEIAVALIKHFEGWFPNLYDDPAGFCTIGYGHLISLKPCRRTDTSSFDPPLSRDEGVELLLDDTRSARYSVQKMVRVKLSHEQFSALSSFVFNVGSGNFQNSTLLKLLNFGDYGGASKQFRRWIKADGVIFRGLQVRRGCEEALFNGTLQFDSNGEFDRQYCVALGAMTTSEPLVDIETGE